MFSIRQTTARHGVRLPNRYYAGPVTDHFDGTRFFHPGLPPTDKSLLDIFKWKIQGRSSTWPAVVPAKTGIRPASRVEGLQITHIGHASYLIQTYNQNILVDPVWSERASPLSFIGPRRHNPPSVAFTDLPSIDAILLSHNHYDHMDLRTIRRICDRDKPRVYAPLGNDTIIRRSAPAANIETGDWWSAFSFTPDIRITIVPSYHWSSRTLGDNRMALWGGFMLKAPAGLVYCAGDTAYRDGAIFHDIRKRFAPPVVAILPIGAYAPRWFMKTQHADPAEAVRIARDCEVKHVLGIHWDTFALTDEPFNEPAEQLAVAVDAEGEGGATFHAFRPGDTWSASEHTR